MTVYMVLFDWSTQDDNAVEVQLFDTYEKAYDRFQEIIANEKKCEMSWAADAFDENGNVTDEYELDEHDDGKPYDCWWNLTDAYDYSIHDFLDLKTVEVK